MPVEYFSVDAKLLRELGERLVGRPHIALAELIKNAYDADARTVEIHFRQAEIEIVDDGHGMDYEAFVGRWMRVGTTHKENTGVTPELRRPYTGSKGVGRLAAQMLARSLTISSVALANPSLRGIVNRHGAQGSQLRNEVSADIDWDEAVEQGELTGVKVDVNEFAPKSKFANHSHVGTRVTLRRLTSRWNADRFRRLAREIWALQPPFATSPDTERSFKVLLISDDPVAEESFEAQMHAILNIWTGKVTASLRDDDGEPTTFELSTRTPLEQASDDQLSAGGNHLELPSRILDVSVELHERERRQFTIRVPNCWVSALSYEIRIFNLVNRQPEGVRVETARSYMEQFGGVHLYDSGFRLPYYGPDIDWLGIEMSHAHRRSRLRLLPSNMQVEDAGTEIPTNSRVYGIANISTGLESLYGQKKGLPSSETLTIQVTRDRLVDNEAYQVLRRLVAVGIDLYALERAKARVTSTRRSTRARSRPPSQSLDQVRQIVQRSKTDLAKRDYKQIESILSDAISDTRTLEESAKAHSALLGALATAGMTALAYEHESSKQRARIRQVSKSLERLAGHLGDSQAEEVRRYAKSLHAWTERANRLRGLFAPLLDEEDRTVVKSYPAKGLVEDVSEQVDVLSRGTRIYVHDLDGLTLPPAGYAAWMAVFQNLIINAYNATLTTPARRIDIDGGSSGRRMWIRVQDTGVGVDLEKAESLFEPFERDMPSDPERAALGLGGSGLGLTIVRMITEEIGCKVAFEAPDADHSTAVRVSWRET